MRIKNIDDEKSLKYLWKSGEGHITKMSVGGKVGVARLQLEESLPTGAIKYYYEELEV